MCYIDLRPPWERGAPASPYTLPYPAVVNVPSAPIAVLATLTEQDKEALRAMILDAVREVFAERDEAKRQQRLNDAW